MKPFFVLTAISLFMALTSGCLCAAEACPFVPVPQEELAGHLEGRTVLSASKPVAFVFQSELERDDDGGPNAYHIGYRGISVDPGLDHICNGGSVLEYNAGSLVDKYRDGGSIGSLSGVDPTTTGADPRFADRITLTSAMRAFRLAARRISA